jgi:hypothetical protein
MAIASVRIYPPIGIARLGNSPDEFFVGPQIPGVRTPPADGYKDAQCRIKRQAAEFRIYGYDAAGALVGEVTDADAVISWTAHLANAKAAWRSFDGLNGATPVRNSGVADRATLVIDPGPRTVAGPGQAAGFNTGTFRGTTVPVGELRTDAAGRLLILGGFGRSGSVPAGAPLPHYANNDGWYDDVSDGPVTATVLLHGTAAPLTASPAWVICAPPDFAPPIEAVTTLYDTLFQVAVDNGWLTVPATPSFTHDVYPILERVIRLKEVSKLGASQHASLAGAVPPASAADRAAVFNRVRNPNAPSVAGPANMPRLWDDENGKRQTITRAQYTVLERWKDGMFVDDWTGAPATPGATIEPDGLTRAALEASIGAAFFPGIEASWFVRSEYPYLEPFRLDHAGRSPGDVTKQMAVPWQADFYECLAADGYAWWPSQRPDDVIPEGGGTPVSWTRDLIDGSTWEQGHLDMVRNWNRLGFVVETSAGVRETERHVVCQSLTLVTDRSTFSRDEVDAALAPASFDDALYAIAEGYLPSELGIAGAHPSPAALAAFAPVVALTRDDGSTVPAMTARPRALLLEDDTLPAGVRQRCTFVYAIEFAGNGAFYVGGVEVELQTVQAVVTKLAASDSGTLTLTHQPNPYLLDGATSWLSTDLRVFQIREGDTRFGLTMGTDGPAFTHALLAAFNAHTAAGHPFDTIATDQSASALELSEKVGGKRVFNFAVARVRYRGAALDAVGVRASFRLFTTAATGTDYSAATTYRRSSTADPVALLGLQGGELVTIPCYAAPRVDSSSIALTAQTDPLNTRTVPHGSGGEVHAYFGCWLDVNQPAPQFPNHPAPGDGPWPLSRRSVQELIRGMHQCLVVEVHLDGDLDPIPEGTSPAAHDNLAQRNLAIVESDNPGSLATHTVQHTFEIKTTRPSEQRRGIQTAEHRDGDERDCGCREQRVPDELVLRWENLPRSTRMLVYLPQIEVDDILRLRARGYEARCLERVDDHTLLCLPGDVTYIPLPEGRMENVAGLLTLELPGDVRRGQEFNVTAQQLSGPPRRVLGAFQMQVAVGEKAELLRPETRKLAVLRHIQQSIPAADRWAPVFERYLDQIAARVRGFGGDPDAVRASPTGGEDEPQPEPPRPEPCALEGDVRLRFRFRNRP